MAARGGWRKEACVAREGGRRIPASGRRGRSPGPLHKQSKPPATLASRRAEGAVHTACVTKPPAPKPSLPNPKPRQLKPPGQPHGGDPAVHGVHRLCRPAAPLGAAPVRGPAFRRRGVGRAGGGVHAAGVQPDGAGARCVRLGSGAAQARLGHQSAGRGRLRLRLHACALALVLRPAHPAGSAELRAAQRCRLTTTTTTIPHHHPRRPPSLRWPSSPRPAPPRCPR